MGNITPNPGREARSIFFHTIVACFSLVTVSMLKEIPSPSGGFRVGDFASQKKTGFMALCWTAASSVLSSYIHAIHTEMSCINATDNN